MAHMSIPCHEGPPATAGHLCSEPAVAGGGRYYCIRVLNYNYGYLQIDAILPMLPFFFSNNRTEKNATSWSYDRLKELLEGLTLEDDKREHYRGPLIDWSSDTVVLWYSGPLIQWSADRLVLWYSGPLIQWPSDTVALWYSGPLIQWFSDILVLWYSGPLIQWSADRLVLWYSGPLIQWSSDTVVCW